MAIDKTVFSDDLTNVIQEMPYDFVLDGKTVECMTGQLDKDEELEIPGVYKNTDLQVSINVDVWEAERTQLPQIGEKPTVDGTEYRISNTGLSTCKKQLMIDLMRV